MVDGIRGMAKLDDDAGLLRDRRRRRRAGVETESVRCPAALSPTGFEGLRLASVNEEVLRSSFSSTPNWRSSRVTGSVFAQVICNLYRSSIKITPARKNVVLDAERTSSTDRDRVSEYRRREFFFPKLLPQPV